MPGSFVYTPTARNAVRVLKAEGDTLTVGGHLVVFDDPASPQKDLAGDYFTRETDFGPARELKMTGQLFHHGMPLKDGTVFDAPLPLLKMTEDEIGIFVETTYDMADDYHRAVGTAIKNSIEKGKPFGWSSSTALQTYKRAADGQILKWWLIEGSPTPTPCEPRTVAGTSVLGKAVPLSSLTPLKMRDGEGHSEFFWRVADAFYTHVASYYWWVLEVYDTFLVAEDEDSGTLYRIGYAEDGSAITFAARSEWVAVERIVSYETLKARAETLRSLRPTGIGSNDFDPELLALSLKLHNHNLATNLRA